MTVLSEISKVLNTGLSPEQLAVIVALCESGVNPEALAGVVKELRREASELKGST
jgi:mitotic-spindle organizing protein 1